MTDRAPRTLQEAMGMDDHETAELRERAERLRCGCLGAPDAPNPQPCPAPATQEDFLCDHCRTVECSTRTSYELDYDHGLCLRLCCPEHTMGEKPTAEVPF